MGRGFPQSGWNFHQFTDRYYDPGGQWLRKVHEEKANDHLRGLRQSGAAQNPGLDRNKRRSSAASSEKRSWASGANPGRPDIGLNHSGGGVIIDSRSSPQTDLNSGRVAGDGGCHQLFSATILVFFFFFA